MTRAADGSLAAQSNASTDTVQKPLSENTRFFKKIIPSLRESTHEILQHQRTQAQRIDVPVCGGVTCWWHAAQPQQARHPQPPEQPEQPEQPRQANPQCAPVVFELHGGGFVLGDARKDDAFCAALRDGTGAHVVGINYPKAPEHPYPAAANAVWEVMTWFAQNAADYAMDANRFALLGFSSGGNLAAGASLRAAAQPAAAQPAAAQPAAAQSAAAQPAAAQSAAAQPAAAQSNTIQSAAAQSAAAQPAAAQSAAAQTAAPFASLRAAAQSAAAPFTVVAQVLHYPFLDAVTPPAQKSPQPWDLSAEVMDAFTELYCAGADPENHMISPVYATPEQLRGVAPALVLTAQRDALQAEGAQYARLLQAAGVDTQYTQQPHAHHGYVEDWFNVACYEATPEDTRALHEAQFGISAQQALDKSVRFLRDCFAR